MSLVTHYYPHETKPFWFRFHPDNQHVVECGGAAYASSYYAVPTSGPFAKPNVQLRDRA